MFMIYTTENCLWCKKAKDLGLIINHEKNGNPALYAVIKDPMMLDNVLPHPQQLQLH